MIYLGLNLFLIIPCLLFYLSVLGILAFIFKFKLFSKDQNFNISDFKFKNAFKILIFVLSSTFISLLLGIDQFGSGFDILIFILIVANSLLFGLMLCLLILRIFEALVVGNPLKIFKTRLVLQKKYKYSLFTIFLLVMSILFTTQAYNTVSNNEFTLESNFVLSNNGSNVYYMIKQDNNTFLVNRDNKIGNSTKFLMPFLCNFCQMRLHVSDKNDKIFFTPNSFSNKIFIFNLHKIGLSNISINYQWNYQIINDTYYHYFFQFSNDNTFTTNLTLQPAQNILSSNFSTFHLQNGITTSMDSLFFFNFYSNFTKLVVYLRSNTTKYFVNYYKVNEGKNYSFNGQNYYNTTLLSSSSYQYYNNSGLYLSPFEPIRFDQKNSVVYYSFYNNINTTLYSLNLQNMKIKSVASLPGEKTIDTVGPNQDYIIVSPFNTKELINVYTLENSNLILKQSANTTRFDNWDNSGEYGIFYQYYSTFIPNDQSNPVVSLIHYDGTKNVIDETKITDQFSLSNESSFFNDLNFIFIVLVALLLIVMFVSYYKDEMQNEIHYY